MARSQLTVDNQCCGDCGLCVTVCPHEALVLRPAYLEILHSDCILCDLCTIACPVEALAIK